MSIINIDVQSTNNNQYPCHSQLIVNANNNSIHFCDENNNFFQDFVFKYSNIN